jgi:tRNA A37 threonylcarbamoyladenosine biosynthesis protein TsaE
LLPKPDKALEELAIKEILDDANNIVVFEWGKSMKILNKYTKIKIGFSIGKNLRRISTE